MIIYSLKCQKSLDSFLVVKNQRVKVENIKAILRQLWMLHSSITEEDFPMLLDNSHRAFFARKFLTNQPSELRSRVLHYSLAGGYYQRIKGNLCVKSEHWKYLTSLYSQFAKLISEMKICSGK